MKVRLPSPFVKNIFLLKLKFIIYFKIFPMKSSNNLFEIPIFVDTNLGTHLALAISPHINVGDLKRKLGQEHFSCFADHGEIEVHALMVKRRSHLYHLPDVMPIKIAFYGYQGTWFLHMHASILQDMPVPKLSSKHSHYSHSQISQLRENQPSISSESKIIESSIGKEEHLLSRHSLESQEACSINLSKEISVTGIISTYFSDEVSSCNKQCNHLFEETYGNEIVGSTKRDSEYSVDQAKPKKMVESDTDTVCSISNVVVSRVRRASKRGYTKAKKGSRPRKIFSTPVSEKVQIGKKLVQAAHNLSISGSGRKLFKPMFVSRCGNLLAPESNVLVRNIAFEINDSDD